MTTIAAVVPIVDDDAKWHAWQQSYAASDRQSGKVMVVVFALAFAAVLVSLFIQLS